MIGILSGGGSGEERDARGAGMSIGGINLGVMVDEETFLPLRRPSLSRS
jgi:hypothetical protein